MINLSTRLIHVATGLALLLVFLSPVYVFADDMSDSWIPPTNPTGGTVPGSGSGGGTQPGSGTGGGTPAGTVNFEPVTLNNPLANIDSLEELLVALLNIFTVLMIPVIVFFIIYAGFKYVVAQGNPSKIEEAHRTLLYAIIGGVLVLAAVAISEIIANTVNQFTTP